MLFLKLFTAILGLVGFIWIWMAFMSGFIATLTTWRVLLIMLVIGLYKWGPQLARKKVSK